MRARYRIIITELLILARESIGVEVRHQFLHASPEALVFLEHVQGVGPSATHRVHVVRSPLGNEANGGGDGHSPAIDAIGWYTGKFAQLLEPLHYDLLKRSLARAPYVVPLMSIAPWIRGIRGSFL
jgi:hypothetical protein